MEALNTRSAVKGAVFLLLAQEGKAQMSQFVQDERVSRWRCKGAGVLSRWAQRLARSANALLRACALLISPVTHFNFSGLYSPPLAANMSSIGGLLLGARASCPHAGARTTTDRSGFSSQEKQKTVVCPQFCFPILFVPNSVTCIAS